MRGSLMDLSDLEAALETARDERNQFAAALETAGEELGHLETKLETALDMVTRASQTLLEIADCDLPGHTGVMWAMDEAKQALADIRTMEPDLE